jgi:hypothetical protein
VEVIGRFAYLANTILCAVLVGYLTSYVITLGSYFTHMLKNAKVEVLQESYAPFRVSSKTKSLYGICFLAQVAIAVVSLLLNHSAHPLPAQVYAVAVLPVFLAIHIATGFGKVEEKMVSGGTMTQQEVDFYTKLNLPLHLIYAALYAISAVWLIAALT